MFFESLLLTMTVTLPFISLVCVCVSNDGIALLYELSPFGFIFNRLYIHHKWTCIFCKMDNTIPYLSYNRGIFIFLRICTNSKRAPHIIVNNEDNNDVWSPKNVPSSMPDAEAASRVPYCVRFFSYVRRARGPAKTISMRYL